MQPISAQPCALLAASDAASRDADLLSDFLVPALFTHPLASEPVSVESPTDKHAPVFANAFAAVASTAYAPVAFDLAAVMEHDAALDSPLGLDLSLACARQGPHTGSSSEWTLSTPETDNSPLFAVDDEFISAESPFITSREDVSPASTTISLSALDLFPPLPGVVAATPSAREAPPAKPTIKPVIESSPQLDERAVSPIDLALSRSDPAAAAHVTEAIVEDDAQPAKRKRGRPPKREHNGSRNTLIPPIALDAPTLPKTYATPSATSKKRLPPAVTAILTGTAKRPRASRGASSSSSSSSSIMGSPAAFIMDDADVEASPELLQEIEIKRRQNTLAARKSRARKAAHIGELEDRVRTLEHELRVALDRCQALERQAATATVV